MERSLAFLLTVLALACSPCPEVEPEPASPSALRIGFSVDGGEFYFCSAHAVSPTELVTAHHCTHKWNGQRVIARNYGSDAKWIALNPDSMRCKTHDISDLIPAGVDRTRMWSVDGVCAFSLKDSSPRFTRFSRYCDSLPSDVASVTHGNRDEPMRSTVCVSEQHGSTFVAHCSVGPRLTHGSSGAGALFGECLGGVMLVEVSPSLTSPFTTLVFSRAQP